MSDDNSAISERNLTPSDQIKANILRGWERAESAYIDGNDSKFIRASKSCMRKVWTFIEEENKTILKELAEKEKDDINKIDEKNPELAREERKKIEFNYAVIRMELIPELINNTSIIMKDVDIDFGIPSDEKEIDKLREMIKQRTQLTEGHKTIR